MLYDVDTVASVCIHSSHYAMHAMERNKSMNEFEAKT